MTEKITLAQADEIGTRLLNKISKTQTPKKKIGDISPTKKHKTEPERIAAIAEQQIQNQSHSLVTDDERKQPVHVLVQKYQHEAIKTLVNLMKNSSSDTVKRQTANDLLSLGGNSSKMLELQAIMTGRSKDVSQMTAEELESFIKNAKDSLQHKIDIAGCNAQNITPNHQNTDPMGGVGCVISMQNDDDLSGDDGL